VPVDLILQSHCFIYVFNFLRMKSEILIRCKLQQWNPISQNSGAPFRLIALIPWQQV
jgi:hypothetical protein